MKLIERIFVTVLFFSLGISKQEGDPVDRPIKERSRQKSFRFEKLDKNEQYAFVLLVFFLKFPKNLTFGRRLFERGWDRSV